MFNLISDPEETTNLAGFAEYEMVMEEMRIAWDAMIKEARGTEPPKVLRFTKDSMLEKGGPVVHEYQFWL